jgi:hypothetical protein
MSWFPIYKRCFPNWTLCLENYFYFLRRGFMDPFLWWQSPIFFLDVTVTWKCIRAKHTSVLFVTNCLQPRERWFSMKEFILVKPHTMMLSRKSFLTHRTFIRFNTGMKSFVCTHVRVLRERFATCCTTVWPFLCMWTQVY